MVLCCWCSFSFSNCNAFLLLVCICCFLWFSDFGLGLLLGFTLLIPVVVSVVGFHFRNLIGCHYWYFFRFGSSIGLLSSLCDNRICLCYSFL